MRFLTELMSKGEGMNYIKIYDLSGNAKSNLVNNAPSRGLIINIDKIAELVEEKTKYYALNRPIGYVTTTKIIMKNGIVYRVNKPKDEVEQEINDAKGFTESEGATF